MKTNTIKYFLFLFSLVLLIACSTKKDKLINRQFQALNTKYNVLYHGNVALEKGITELKVQYKDNFWEILPIERMQVEKDVILPGKTKNQNFERAEEKATKAIQKRSMNIKGKEKNPQIDEAHILLGKARYYDQRFLPALEAFNYVLYKYPESDKIYEAKIWHERINMRLENDVLAIKNLKRLLKVIDFKDQVFADANATLSQAFLNLNQKDSAVVYLKSATAFTKSDEEKARYRFILGQLYDELGYKDSAFVAFQSVIDMNRKASRPYVIYAHAKQASQFDFEKGDSLVFIKKFKSLLQDRENRPYLDILNHQVAVFYDKKKYPDQAKYYYNASLKAKTGDQVVTGLNYRSLAKIAFDKTEYLKAGQYYDSTLVTLREGTKDYIAIKKKRENLSDVIKYEAIAKVNDSILAVTSLTEEKRNQFYSDYIAKLKEKDAAREALEKRRSENEERRNNVADNVINNMNDSNGMLAKSTSMAPPSMPPPAFGPRPTGADANVFYFYNTPNVALGKIEFKKKWGNRTLRNNWRISSERSGGNQDNTDVVNTVRDNNSDTENEKKENPEYSVSYYINQLPKTQKALDSIVKDRNYAYYQLGTIYKEKFQEYQLASNKLEQLLQYNPEERLILPSLYNLYKIYEITDPAKAEVTKNKIISQYPDSRYAQIISNGSNVGMIRKDTPEQAYEKLYKRFEKGDLHKLTEKITQSIELYNGEEIVPKLELLKANTIGKVKGLTEYKAALNYVALNYPNSEEGKEAEKTIATTIPVYESMQLYKETPQHWKVLYKVQSTDTINIKNICEKIKKFIAEMSYNKVKYSVDTYSETESFIVIHGINSFENAKGVIAFLKGNKNYKLATEGTIISSEDYKVVQIKKNFDEYLKTFKNEAIQPKTAAIATPKEGAGSPPAPIDPTPKLKKE
ncbi:MAG TPA: gliding motility protein [Flavobacterium sp.]